MLFPQLCQFIPVSIFLPTQLAHILPPRLVPYFMSSPPPRPRGREPLQPHGIYGADLLQRSMHFHLKYRRRRGWRRCVWLRSDTRAGPVLTRRAGHRTAEKKLIRLGRAPPCTPPPLPPDKKFDTATDGFQEACAATVLGVVV